MAIYFEDKILHPKKDGSELERIYAEGMEEIEALYKKHNGSLTLRQDVELVSDTTGTSFKPVPPTSLPHTVHFNLDQLGSVSIRYSKSSPTKQDKAVIYPTERLWIQEALPLDKTQKDLAWFLIKASNMVRDDNDPGTKNRILYIEDVEKKDENRAEDLRRFMKLDNLLFDENSEIFNRESLQKLVDKFGLEVSAGTTVALALAIRDKVVEADKKNNPMLNVRLFIEAVEKMVKIKNDMPEGPYTRQQLELLPQLTLNAISRKMGTTSPPQCKKSEQISNILTKQEIEVEA